MSSTPPARGRVYAVYLPAAGCEKYVLVVSNNKRNQQLGDFLAVRLTTTSKVGLPTCVELGRDEPFSGWVVCDDIIGIPRDHIRRDIGVISPGAMQRVNHALQLALYLNVS